MPCTEDRPTTSIRHILCVRGNHLMFLKCSLWQQNWLSLMKHGPGSLQWVKKRWGALFMESSLFSDSHTAGFHLGLYLLLYIGSVDGDYCCKNRGRTITLLHQQMALLNFCCHRSKHCHPKCFEENQNPSSGISEQLIQLAWISKK